MNRRGRLCSGSKVETLADFDLLIEFAIEREQIHV